MDLYFIWICKWSVIVISFIHRINSEAANANLIVFGLPQPGLESTIYHTRGDHTNNYTTDTVNKWNDNNRAFAYSYKIKIHFGLLDQIVLYIIILKTKATRTEIFILQLFTFWFVTFTLYSFIPVQSAPSLKKKLLCKVM
jgi:hypothetical protein